MLLTTTSVTNDSNSCYNTGVSRHFLDNNKTSDMSIAPRPLCPTPLCPPTVQNHKAFHTSVPQLAVADTHRISTETPTKS